MGAWGALIMGFFGAVFAALTMSWAWHVSGLTLALPFLGFAAIGVAAAAVIRLPGDGIVPSATARRTIMWSSVGEGVGMFVAGNVVNAVGRPDLLLPAMALVVGVHFLPIAFAAAFRPFYVLGVALIAAALAGFVVPAPVGGEVAGTMAAAALWIAAVVAVHRDRRARRPGAMPA